LLNKQIATSLFCGLMTDTGWFIFNSNRPEFHLVMARLMMEDVDRENIIKESHVVPERKLRLEGYLINQKLHVVREHKAAYMSLSLSECRRYGHQKGDSEGYVNDPLDIEGVQVSAFFREEKNFVKVSLRSKGEYPVNLIAEKFYNGGGHRNAAGGEFYGSLSQAEAIFIKVLPLFDKYLK
jgi:phosphoesterase RecJ-like protein